MQTRGDDMHFKRNEPFRYEFGQPIPALFNIIRINNREVESSGGQAEIIEVSPEGLRIKSKLNIPDIKTNQIMLTISFELNNKIFKFEGYIVWKKELSQYTTYGLKLVVEDEKREEFIEELKIFTKQSKK